MRTAGIWFDTLGTDARRIATENPGVSMRQSEPVPDITFDRSSSSTPTACASNCIAAVGETIDSAIVWLPERRTALDQQSASARSSRTSRTSTPCGGTGTASSSRTWRACAPYAPCDQKSSSPADTTPSSARS